MVVYILHADRKISACICTSAPVQQLADPTSSLHAGEMQEFCGGLGNRKHCRKSNRGLTAKLKVYLSSGWTRSRPSYTYIQTFVPKLFGWLGGVVVRTSDL